MDIQTKDGIMLRGIPDGTPDDAIKARIEKIRAESSKKGSPFASGGDVGSLLSAGAAFGAANDAIEHGIYTIGGKATDAATSLGAPPKVAGGIGYATNVGLGAIPAFIGNSITTPAKEAARWLMGTAVKPLASANQSGRGARAIETMLEQGYNPTQSGVEKMWNRVGDLNKEVEGVIGNSAKALSSDQVTGNAMANTLRRFQDRPEVAQASADVAGSASTFRNHPTIQNAQRYGADEIPIQEAQRLKRGYQQSIGDRGYGELKTPTVEMEKALARELREGISAAEPRVAEINKLEADLINAAKVAQRRAYAHGNNNPVPLGASIGMATNNPVATAGLWANSSDYAKSMLARMLYKGAGAPGAATGAAIGAQTMMPPEEQILMGQQLRGR